MRKNNSHLTVNHSFSEKKKIYFHSSQNKSLKNPYIDHTGIQSLQSACIHADILSGKRNNIREWGPSYQSAKKKKWISNGMLINTIIFFREDIF